MKKWIILLLLLSASVLAANETECNFFCKVGGWVSGIFAREDALVGQAALSHDDVESTFKSTDLIGIVNTINHVPYRLMNKVESGGKITYTLDRCVSTSPCLVSGNPVGYQFNLPPAPVAPPPVSVNLPPIPRAASVPPNAVLLATYGMRGQDNFVATYIDRNGVYYDGASGNVIPGGKLSGSWNHIDLNQRGDLEGKKNQAIDKFNQQQAAAPAPPAPEAPVEPEPAAAPALGESTSFPTAPDNFVNIGDGQKVVSGALEFTKIPIPAGALKGKYDAAYQSGNNIYYLRGKQVVGRSSTTNPNFRENDPAKLNTQTARALLTVLANPERQVVSSSQASASTGTTTTVTPAAATTTQSFVPLGADLTHAERGKKLDKLASEVAAAKKWNDVNKQLQIRRKELQTRQLQPLTTDTLKDGAIVKIGGAVSEGANYNAGEEIKIKGTPVISDNQETHQKEAKFQKTDGTEITLSRADLSGAQILDPSVKKDLEVVTKSIITNQNLLSEVSSEATAAISNSNGDHAGALNLINAVKKAHQSLPTADLSKATDAQLNNYARALGYEDLNDYRNKKGLATDVNPKILRESFTKEQVEVIKNTLSEIKKGVADGSVTSGDAAEKLEVEAARLKNLVEAGKKVQPFVEKTKLAENSYLEAAAKDVKLTSELASLVKNRDAIDKNKELSGDQKKTQLAAIDKKLAEKNEELKSAGDDLGKKKADYEKAKSEMESQARNLGVDINSLEQNQADLKEIEKVLDSLQYRDIWTDSVDSELGKILLGENAITPYMNALGIFTSKAASYQPLSNLIFPSMTKEYAKKANSGLLAQFSDLPGVLGADFCEAVQDQSRKQTGTDAIFIQTAGGTYQFVGSIQAEKSEKESFIFCDKDEEEKYVCKGDLVCKDQQFCYKPNKDTPEKGRFYKVTWGVTAPSDEAQTPFIDENGIAVKFNVFLDNSEPIYARGVVEDATVIQLSNGESDNGIIAKFLDHDYNEVCIRFANPIRDRYDNPVNQMCAEFRLSDKGVIQYGDSTRTSPKSFTSQGPGVRTII